MKRYIFPGILLTAFSLPVAAFSLPAHAAPPNTAVNNAVVNNVVVNGDFEQTEDGMPAHWVMPDARPDLKMTVAAEKGHGKVVQLDMSGSLKSALVSQKVKIEPHTRYRLSALARLSDGKLAIGVQDGANPAKVIGRNYGEPDTRLPMLPLFWDEAWSQSVPFIRGTWRTITFDFHSQEMTEVYLTFGAYFAIGKYAFDDISLVALGPSQPSHE